MAEPAEAPFRFMDLPPELRNRIYRCALCKEGSIAVTQVGYDRPALLQTCKQARQEALGIYYGSDANRFRMCTSDYDSIAVYTF